MEIRVRRWQLLGVSGAILILLIYLAAFQLQWEDRVITVVGVDSDSRTQDRSGYAFSTVPHGHSPMKSGPSQVEIEGILLKVETEFQAQCRNILEGKPKSGVSGGAVWVALGLPSAPPGFRFLPVPLECGHLLIYRRLQQESIVWFRLR